MLWGDLTMQWIKVAKHPPELNFYLPPPDLTWTPVQNMWFRAKLFSGVDCGGSLKIVNRKNPQPSHPPPPTISRFRAKLFLVWRIPVNRQNPTNPSQSSTPYDQAIKKQSVGPPMGSNGNLKCECCEAILTQIWSRAEKVNRAIVGRMSNNMHCWANVGHCWANPMLANQTGRLWDLRGPLSRREEIWQKSSYDLALTFSI